MTKRPTVKILVGYHKPATLFQSDILVPIHMGRSLETQASKDGTMSQEDYQWMLDNMIGDDTGTNLSKENRYLNEMSGIYWAWANYDRLDNPDYIGFMQCAKHLICNPHIKISKDEWLPNGKVCIYDLSYYLNMNNLSEKYILPLIEKYDCLCPEKYNLSNLRSHPKTCRERFEELSRGKVEVFDLMGSIVSRKFPQFIPYFKELETTPIHYPLNIFIMRRDLFQMYGEFVFGVLSEILRQSNLSQGTIIQKRSPAYCAEFLTSMYLSSLIKDGYKIKTLNVAVLPAKYMLMTNDNVRSVETTIWRDKINYLKYKILSKIVWGKKRQHYKEKKGKIRAYITEKKHKLDGQFNGDSEIKILIGYHRPAVLLKGSVFVPIHLGRALATKVSKDCAMTLGDHQWMLDHMIGDNTGDNISSLNREYCETTAMYWAWKNYRKLGNPKYIGFMHYRRHLCFDERNVEDVQASLGAIYNERINWDYIKKYQLSKQQIIKAINEYDIVTSEKEDVSLVGAKDVRDIWNINGKLNPEDIDFIVKKMVEMYPDYGEASRAYLSGPHAYLKNIFIMKKKYFMEFCKILFDVLFSCQHLCEKYNDLQKRRVLAYASEWIFGIYITKKQTQGCKCLELKRTYVQDTDEMDRDTRHLLISFDSNYYRHAYTLLNSIFKNNTYGTFCVHVLYSKLKADYINRMTHWIEMMGHHARFYHVDEEKIRFCPIKKGDKVTRSAYFRLFATQYLPKDVKKVLYLDIDTCCLRSLKALFDMGMEGIPVRAVFGWSNEERRRKLGMLPIHKYFNSGVLLINMEYWRQHNCVDGFIQFIADHRDCLERWDQDVINGYFKGKIGNLPLKYNVTSPFFDKSYLGNGNPFFMQWLIAEKRDAGEYPFILHFTGFDQMKPWWEDSTADPNKRNIWLSYRKDTPFGGDRLRKYKEFHFSESVKLWWRKVFSCRVEREKNIADAINNLQRKIMTVERLRPEIQAAVLHPATFGEFKGVNQGRNFVLCGSGPSILCFNSSMIGNCKYCGVNSSVKKEDIDFDYLFCQDNHFEKGKNECINEYNNGKCIKFYGKVEARRATELDSNIGLQRLYRCSTHTHQLPFQDILTTKARPYILSEYMGQMPYNIECEPVADIGGTIFSAMQFALFTNPKRIFLLGCDHTSGYFYDQQFRMFDASFQANVWVRFIIPYVQKNYPNIQIFSINPVGLKGLFRDVYTESYVKEHPEIKKPILLKEILGD